MHEQKARMHAAKDLFTAWDINLKIWCLIMDDHMFLL